MGLLAFVLEHAWLSMSVFSCLFIFPLMPLLFHSLWRVCDWLRFTPLRGDIIFGRRLPVLDWGLKRLLQQLHVIKQTNPLSPSGVFGFSFYYLTVLFKVNLKVCSSHTWQFYEYAIACEVAQETCHPRPVTCHPRLGRGWQVALFSEATCHHTNDRELYSVRTGTSLPVRILEFLEYWQLEFFNQFTIIFFSKFSEILPITALWKFWPSIDRLAVRRSVLLVTRR